jgi:hypothetical protein
MPVQHQAILNALLARRAPLTVMSTIKALASHALLVRSAKDKRQHVLYLLILSVRRAPLAAHTALQTTKVCVNNVQLVLVDRERPLCVLLLVIQCARPVRQEIHLAMSMTRLVAKNAAPVPSVWVHIQRVQYRVTRCVRHAKNEVLTAILLMKVRVKCALRALLEKVQRLLVPHPRISSANFAKMDPHIIVLMTRVAALHVQLVQQVWGHHLNALCLRIRCVYLVFIARRTAMLMIKAHVRYVLRALLEKEVHQSVPSQAIHPVHHVQTEIHTVSLMTRVHVLLVQLA